MSPKNNKMIEIERKLASYKGKDRVVSSHEMKEYLDNQPTPVWEVDSGFPYLDNMIQGWGAGDLIVISGRTKEGKTSLGQSITKNMAENEVATSWFTYEIGARAFLQTFGEDKDDIPLFYLPKELKSSGIEWIKKRILEAKVKYEAKVVFIDHLHYLLNMGNLARSGNTSLVIGGIMRELKKTAIYLNVCIFIICHLTKVSLDRKPSLKDLRDSSFIAQEADYVVFIARVRDEKTEEATNQALVYLAANRKNGRLGKFKVIMKDNLFKELDENQQDTKKMGGDSFNLD